MMRFGIRMRSFRHHHFSFGDCYIRVEEGGPDDGSESGGPFLSSRGEKCLFFLHGRFEHTEMWRPVINALIARFRCFMIDLPGFGHSFSVRDRGLSLLEQAHLVQQLILRFRRQHDQVILVGHDTGGGIAQLCAVQYGQAAGGLAGLVLVSSSVLHEPPQGLNPGWFGLSARWKLIRLLNQSGYVRPEWEEALVAPWFIHSSRRSLIRAWRALEESWPGYFERQFWRGELQRLELPVLLLWGGHDALNEPEKGRRLVQSLRDAHFYVNSRVGHWPSLEDPQWVVSKLQEFAFRAAPRADISKAAVGY